MSESYVIQDIFIGKRIKMKIKIKYQMGIILERHESRVRVTGV
jgi:hypothetical protein